MEEKQSQGGEMEFGERLARIEAKLEHLSEVMEDFVDGQGDKNALFFQMRDEFLQTKASAKGVWFTIGIFGTLTVAVSSVVAWLVSNFHLRG